MSILEENDIIADISKLTPELGKNEFKGCLYTIAKHPNVLLDPPSVRANEIRNAIPKVLNRSSNNFNQQAHVLFSLRAIDQYCSEKNTTSQISTKQSCATSSFFHQPDKISQNEMTNRHQDEEKNPFSPVTPTLKVR
jgi:hypothetical protein